MTVAEVVVGRAEVMARIADVLDAGRRGSAGVVSLVGVAGSGKSTVVGATAALAEPGELVLRATGHPAETELPYGGLHQLLRPLWPDLDPTLRGALALGPAPPADRMSVAASLLTLLTATAADRLVMVLVDDTHWLDTASRQALTFCSRRLDADAVVMLLSGRPSDASGDGTVIALGPLGHEEARALLHARHAQVHSAVEERILAAAEGLPLALVEISDALTEAQRRGAASLPPILPIGPSINRLHAPRLDQLDDDALRALVIASLEPLTAAALDGALAAAGLSGADLARSEALGLIVLVDGRWELPHPTVRSAVLSRATAPMIREAHALHAESAEDVVARAWHLHHASAVPQQAIADVLADAAAVAQSRGAFSEAAECWLAAVTHTPDAQRRYACTESAVECLLAAGLTARAVEHLDHLVELAPDDTTRARWQSHRLGLGLWRSESGKTDHGELVRLAGRLLDGPETGSAEDLLTTVAVACDAWGLDRPQGLTDVLRQRFPEPRPAYVVADAVRGVPGSVEMLRGPWIEDLTVPRSLGETGAVIVAGYTLLWLDHVDACERLVDRMEQFDLPPLSGLRATARQLSGLCAMRRGDWGRADLELTITLRIAIDGELAMVEGSNRLHQAQLAVLRGDDRAAEDMLSLAGEVVPPDAPWSAFAAVVVRAGIHVNRGEYEAAVAAYADAESIELHHAFGAPSLNCRFNDHVSALLRLGRVDEARAVVGRYQDFTAPLSAPTIAGALELERGRIEGDLAAFDRALDHFRTAIDRFAEARCLLVWGEVLRRRRQRSAAVRKLTEAQAIFASLGAEPWTARATAELAACGVRRAANPADPVLSVLTPREYEIARAVASGLSNAETAQRLFISVRTVGYHLANTYQKLGIHDRGELNGLF